MHLYYSIRSLSYFIMSSLDFSFKHPTSIQMFGHTQFGKIRLVLRFLDHQVIQPFQTTIILIYSESQPDYNFAARLYLHIEFEHGWKDYIYNRIRPDQTNLLIVDDQMEEAGSSKTLQNLFNKGSHHRNLTIIYLLQNMYNANTTQRTVSLNTHYNVVFKNPQNVRQFRCPASQMHPGNFYWLIHAFNDATAKPHGYLVLDHHSKSDDDERVVTNILTQETLTYYSSD